MRRSIFAIELLVCDIKFGRQSSQVIPSPKSLGACHMKAMLR